MSKVPSWLPLAVFLVLAVGSAARLVALRRVNINAFVVRAGDDAHGFLCRVFVFLVAATFIFCAVHAVRPASAAALGPLPWLTHGVVAWGGAVLAVAGAGLAVAAQLAMGRSWRIGFREDDETALVSSGLYHFSRNPIYLGTMGAMTGIFLMVPNGLTLALLIATWIAASTQIRLEEDFLSRKHGPAYEAYRSRTPRWLW